MITETEIIDASVIRDEISRRPDFSVFLLSFLTSVISHVVMIFLCLGIGLLPGLKQIMSDDPGSTLLADLISRQEYRNLVQPPPPDAEKNPEERPKEEAVPPPPADAVKKTEKPPRLKGAASDQEFDGPVVFDVEWSQQNAYIRKMLPMVKAHIKYSRSEAPPEKVRSVISFSLRIDGTVSDILVYSSSGFDTLDRIALKALADASPFPSLPAEAGVVDSLKGKIRITFNPARH